MSFTRMATWPMLVNAGIPLASWGGCCVPPGSQRARSRKASAHLADVGQVAEALGVIDAVADHEHVGDGEADEVDLAALDLAPRRLVEKGAGPDLRRPALEQEGAGEGERAAGVLDVVDEQHGL